MHPSRLEIIKDVFTRTDLVHLNTSYVQVNANDLSVVSNNHINEAEVRLIVLEHIYKDVFTQGLNSGYKTRDYGTFNGVSFPNKPQFLANGPCAIKREVTEKVRYKEKSSDIIIWEDQDFNYEVFYSFNRSAIINNPLYYYYMGSNTGGCSY